MTLISDIKETMNNPAFCGMTEQELEYLQEEYSDYIYTIEPSGIAGYNKVTISDDRDSVSVLIVE